VTYATSVVKYFDRNISLSHSHTHKLSILQLCCEFGAQGWVWDCWKNCSWTWNTCLQRIVLLWNNRI